MSAFVLSFFWASLAASAVALPVPPTPRDEASPLTPRASYDAHLSGGAVVGAILGSILGFTLLIGFGTFVFRNRTRYQKAIEGLISPASRLPFYSRASTPSDSKSVRTPRRKTHTSSFQSPMPDKLLVESADLEVEGLPELPWTRFSMSSSTKERDYVSWVADSSITGTPGHAQLEFSSLTVPRADDAHSGISAPLTPLAPVFDALLGSRRNSTATIDEKRASKTSIMSQLRAIIPRQRRKSKNLPPLPSTQEIHRQSSFLVLERSRDSMESRLSLDSCYSPEPKRPRPGRLEVSQYSQVLDAAPPSSSSTMSFTLIIPESPQPLEIFKHGGTTMSKEDVPKRRRRASSSSSSTSFLGIPSFTSTFNSVSIRPQLRVDTSLSGNRLTIGSNRPLPSSPCSIHGRPLPIPSPSVAKVPVVISPSSIGTDMYSTPSA